MDQLPQAHEVATRAAASPAAPPEVPDCIKQHLYTRACNQVVSFFSRPAGLVPRAGAPLQVAVMKAHLGGRLPEFLAWVQSKGYDTQVGENTVLVSAPPA